MAAIQNVKFSQVLGLASGGQNVMSCHIGAACNLVLNVRFYQVLNVGFCWVLTCPKTNRNLTVVLMLVLVKKLPFA